ncbi:Nitrate reductase [Rhynchospora pubera]|uniref:Nitrate reductase n=1 Tax=Rhynchospora pubera TaxID=906938 RepID=A0AAV8CCK5_9POAL|nr:Nitrate reductase [Rhynchospora pubera]
MAMLVQRVTDISSSIGRNDSQNDLPFQSFAADDDDSDEETYDWESLYASHQDVEPPTNDYRDDRTPDSWVKRSPTLIRVTVKHPVNCEPPLHRLMKYGFITPASLHYVRNHGSVPQGDWSTWTVEVTGLVKQPYKFIMDELVNEFEPIEIPVTLACSANRCKEQNMVRRTIGFNWGAGAISTSVWRGARLTDILQKCGVMGAKSGAMYVCFEGAEDSTAAGGNKYGTSIRIEVAMDPSRDVMLAYRQNDELLLPDHGFPVRVIVPGFTCGRSVKWVKRIIVTRHESENNYHYSDNRLLPSHVDLDLANAEGWWYKPEYVINEMNVNSVITTPGHDEILPINSSSMQRTYTMRGYAHSGGGRKVRRVEITLDGGETWRLCTLNHPEVPTKYGKYWCWCFWSVEIELIYLLHAKEIAVRAWDESNNTQPNKFSWNILGVFNNSWFRVRIHLRRFQEGGVGLVFAHPTQPGNGVGGWMERDEQTATRTKVSYGARQSTILTLRESTPVLSTNTLTKQYRMHEVSEQAGVSSISRSLITTSQIVERESASNISDMPIALSNPREKVKCTLVSKTETSRDTRIFRFALPSSEQVLGLPIGKHIFLHATVNGKLRLRKYTPTSLNDEKGHFDLLIKVYFKGENPQFPDGGVMSQHLDSLPIGSTIDIKGPLGDIEYCGRGHFLVDGERRFAKRLAMIAGGTGITPIYQVMQAILRDQPDDTTEMHLVYANRSEDDILLREDLDKWSKMYPKQLKVWYVVDEVKHPELGWKYSIGHINEDILKEHLPFSKNLTPPTTDLVENVAATSNDNRPRRSRVRSILQFGQGKRKVVTAVQSSTMSPISENQVPLIMDNTSLSSENSIGEDALALICGPPPMIKFAVLPNLEKIGYDLTKQCLTF